MHLINIPMMIDTVKHTVVEEDEPAFFWGPPGCGKSEGMAEAARQLDADLVDIRLGQYDSIDLRGIPDTETGMTVWNMPSTLPFAGNPNFDPDRRKLIFLDEANAGKPSVLGVAYQLVQEGRIGEHVLQPNTHIVAAGNRESDRGVTNKLPLPLSNRFTHFDVGPDAQAWILWAATQPRVPAEMLAFLQFRQELISNFDPKSPEKAFATPRTIFKACKYDSSPTMPEGIKDASIEGAVGEAFAAEYRGFKQVISRMPSLKDIEADPMGAPVFEEPEIKWAIAVGIAGELRPDNEAAYSKYLGRMDAEFGILAWQIGLLKNEALIGTQGFIRMAKEHQAIFAAANRND